MRKTLRTMTSSQDGQYLEIFLILFVVLIGFTALAVDGGRYLVERRRVQNAADNAALATASAYCQNLPDYYGIGISVANANFADSDESSYTVTINIPPVYGETAGHEGNVEVIINATISSTFANIFNVSSFSTSARAVGYCQRGGGMAIFAGADDCGPGGRAIDWSGSGIIVDGGIHSNDNFYVGGSDNQVNGTTTIVNLADSEYGSVTFIPPPPGNPLQGSLTEYPIDFNSVDFAPGGSKAIAAGSNYHSHNQVIDLGWLEDQGLYNPSTHSLAEGLYYTPDNIDLSAGPIYANSVTFVAGGEISFSGSNQVLRPYTSGLLAFSYYQPSNNECTTPAVKMSGSSNNWGGIIFAPNAMIEMSGSDNTSYDGGLIGWSVRVNGSNMSLSYNADYFSPLISLME